MAHESIDDPLFGTLTWDFELHIWDGRSSTAAGSEGTLLVYTGVEDMVPPIDDAEVPREISAASREAFVRFRNAEPTVRRRLALAQPEPITDAEDRELTRDELAARLRFVGLTIYTDGSAEVYFDDDHIFGGHTLMANLDPTGELDGGETFG